MTPRESLQFARRLFKDGRIDKALEVVGDVPSDYSWGAADLILKARLIQLASDDGGFSLDDAAACLQNATLQNPSDPFALMELAFFESRPGPS